MRIATGSISHESSSFTPIPTPYEAFSETALGFHRGPAIIQAMRGINLGIGGFIDAADEFGFELVPLLWTFADPSSFVAADAWQRLKGEFLERLQDAMPVDGALFDLHGAMAVEGVDDAEGDLLTDVRAILGPDRPIFVTLDLHANIGPQMAEAADALIPCDHSPHTDLGERGREAADLIVSTVRGEIRPTMAWHRLPMLWIGGQYTGLEPFDSIVARAHEIESRPGVLTCSVAPGFPWVDIPIAGASVIVVADGDPELARREATAYGDWIYAQRESFLPDLLDFDEALAGARAADRWPTVIADPQDNPGGGMPGDSTGIIQAFLDAGLEDAVILTIWDPEVARTAHAAGKGAEITVDLGGKSAPSQGLPVHLTAEVEGLTDGRFEIKGPMHTGARQDMGLTAVLRTGGLRIVVTSNRFQAFDAETPRSVGIEPTEHKWIGLKSSSHFRAAYAPIVGSIFRVAFPSYRDRDPARLGYTRLQRPIWPLDR